MQPPRVRGIAVFVHDTNREKKRKFLEWTKRWQLCSAPEELALTLQAVRSRSCDVLSQQWHSLRARPTWPHRSWSANRHSPTLAVWALCSIRVELSVQELTEGQCCLTEKWMSVQQKTAEGGKGGRAQECLPCRQILESFESFRKAS